MTAIRQRTVPSLLAAAIVIDLVLIQPNHPAALGWKTLLLFPLELPVILLGLVALREGRASKLLRVGLVIALMLIATLKSADFVSFTALSRGFNPVADMFLVDAFVRLLAGTLGLPLTVAAILGSILCLALVGALLWWATGVWSRLAVPPRARRLAGVVAVLGTGAVIADVGHATRVWHLPADLPGAAFTARVGVESIDEVRSTLTQLREFREAAREDAFAGERGLFGAIDRDVIVVFVESYGRTSLDTPFYADMHRNTLAEYEDRLGGLGLAMQSGFLNAPTHGGQSWLSHATFANGLWINSQKSYGAALTSGRETLFHYAANNGFRTAAVMPQITLEWPESELMGYETVLVADDLGYRGLPFNWVTMPDQFTLAAMDRLLRNGIDDRRLFAQVALASSHAPWVPVPELVPWESIGDGQVFNAMTSAGDPTEVIWRDRERVRQQYRLAIDYSLRTVFEYTALHADDPPLLIIMGDHQASGLISMDERHDVPIHVIGPEHLVAPLAEAAPHAGLLPGDDAPALAMDRMRDILLEAYSLQTNVRLGN